MSLDGTLVLVAVGAAAGWLVARIARSARARRASGSCAGGCGCSSRWRDKPPR